MLVLVTECITVTPTQRYTSCHKHNDGQSEEKKLRESDCRKAVLKKKWRS